jgi:hypothetical protein
MFLEMFAAPGFLDISLNQWMLHLPKLIVKEHTNLTDQEIDWIPGVTTPALMR